MFPSGQPQQETASTRGGEGGPGGSLGQAGELPAVRKKPLSPTAQELWPGSHTPTPRDGWGWCGAPRLACLLPWLAGLGRGPHLGSPDPAGTPS